MPPVYEYKAYGPGGKQQKGITESENQKAARQKLKKQGLAVYEIAERSSAKTKKGIAEGQKSSFFQPKASVKDVAHMTRQIASLVKANIPLVDTLAAMVEQTEHQVIKLTLAQVRQDVTEGSSLAKAMVKHPRVFDNIFINMIEAGESSGTLSLVLMKLADLKEAQMRLRQKIVSGMTYPGLMLGVAALLMVGMFGYVIPQMKTIFVSMNKPMPPITQFLIDFSDFMISYWYLLIAFMVGGFFFFLKTIRSPAGKEKWDAFKLKLPILGPLIRLIGVTRFASTMSTLLASGVPILGAMNISKNLVGNVLLERAISSARENITEGQSIAGPLQKSGQFPPMVIHMISIGEKTGELPEMLKNVAETYEEQVSTKIEGLTSLLEPIMIVFMGGLVGFIVMAVMSPLLDMSNINN
jgi:general secretion pathway protein F